MDDWIQRDRASSAFWSEYVRAARARCATPVDSSDQMRVAMNECFSKMDKAIAEANASGCTLFKCTLTRKQPEKIRLVFSDGKGKTFRRTLKIDARFQRNGLPLEFLDFLNLKMSLQTIILDEENVHPDPKAGWISL